MDGSVAGFGLRGKLDTESAGRCWQSACQPGCGVTVVQKARSAGVNVEGMRDELQALGMQQGLPLALEVQVSSTASIPLCWSRATA